MHPKDFVHKYKPYAHDTEKKTEISAVAILAQSALETGWGEKAPGNMMFGVKASHDTPSEKRQLITTTEYLRSPHVKFPQVISITKMDNGLFRYKVKDWFRKYDSPEESFTDHAKFFLHNERYKKALEVKHDAYKFIEEIAKAGYATDPHYAETLKNVAKLVEKYYGGA